MSYDITDFDKICRTCLAETIDSKGLFSVQLINDENVTLSDLLAACTSLEVRKSDGLPQQICLQCIQFMLGSFSFQQQCHKSDSTLKALISGALQTQFIDLKPPDISSIRIKELFCNSSLPTKDVEETLNNQDIQDSESLNNHEQGDNINSDLVPSTCGSEASLNDTSCNTDLEIKFASATSKESNRIRMEQKLLGRDIQQQELAPSYQTFRNASGEIKIQPQRVDETAQPLFPCEDRGCVACFTTENDLKHHMKTHGRTHYCKPCNKMFSSASTLSRHFNNKHQKGKKLHLCSECGKGFGRSDDLRRHLRVHTGERPFKCEKCGKAFAQSFRLLEHVRAHLNEKNFICAICGKAFSRYTSLLGHTKTHSAIKSHECKECGKRLCNASSLSMHMKVHTGERNHVCNYCGKGFASHSNLTTHKRMHTGEKPYVCNTCGKAFPDPSRLNVHNRIHSGEKPYVCSYCNRGCVSSSQLKKHIRIHTGERPYQCKMCEKNFYRSEDLKIHIKIHKGERNHVCLVCEKGFYQATTLKVHMRIHTGEKPYHCNLCNKSFSQTGPYSIHMKTHVIEKVMIPQNIEMNEHEKIIQYL